MHYKMKKHLTFMILSIAAFMLINLVPVVVEAASSSSEKNQKNKSNAVTEVDAYWGVYCYCDSWMNLDTEEGYHSFLSYEGEEEGCYTFLFRSYTGAYGKYYVDEKSGDVYVAWKPPFSDDFEERGSEPVTNIFQWLSQFKVVVALGDSYSSGEGLGEYGVKTDLAEKISDPDWLAHRSENAWPGNLLVSPRMGLLHCRRNVNWFFAASSGAETVHLQKKQKIDYDKNPYPANTKELDSQLQIFKKVPKGSVSYVTVTIGGNDLGFENILLNAALCPSYILPNWIPSMLRNKWREFYSGKKGDQPIREKIKKAYKDIADAAGKEAEIIVAGYPELLDYEGKGRPFSVAEAREINKAAVRLDKELSNIVEECKKEKININYVTVWKAFKTHQAYSEDPYINGVVYVPGWDDLKDLSASSLISAASFHPNKAGAEKYRELVQDAINDIEKRKNTNQNEKNDMPPSERVIDYRSIYKDIVKETLAVRHDLYTQEDYRSFTETLGRAMRVTLADMDGDGIDELFLYIHLSINKGYLYIFSTSDDNASEAFLKGSIPMTSINSIKIYDNGLLCNMNDLGTVSVNYYYFDNAKGLVGRKIYEKQVYTGKKYDTFDYQVLSDRIDVEKIKYVNWMESIDDLGLFD